MQIRSLERLRVHYELEKQLALRLKQAPKSERAQLYTKVYDELFRQISDHPQLTEKANPEIRQKAAGHQLKLLSRFLTPETIFLEIGAGDCALSRAVALRVQQVFAVDVSPEITRNAQLPANAELVLLENGTELPLLPETVTLAYSYQLMEHLHPHDACAQLGSIYRVLKTGGKYVCVTPNRLAGPHDISYYFDDMATGFHLKEYTATELAQLFRAAGFKKISFYAGGRGICIRLPLFFVRVFEKTLEKFSPKMRKKIARTFLMRAILGITLVAKK
jgi:SAM-dependent methyltransferase